MNIHPAETDPSALPALFFHNLDHRRYDALLALLDANCCWHRQGLDLNGREAISEVLDSRPADRVTRHLLSAMILKTTTDGLTVELVVSGLGGHLSPETQLPLPVDLPLAVMDYRFNLVACGEAWHIAAIHSESIFKRC